MSGQSSVRLDDLLVFTRRAEVSDLHLTVGVPPVLRIDGQLRAIEGFKPLMPADTRSLAMELLDEKQMVKLEHDRELDLSFGRRGAGRYRLNVYWQRGSIGLAIRVIRSTIPTIDELGLPQITKQFAMSDKGLLLVTGPTGSGKSTTLAAMIQYINQNDSCHIITVEDPIEYLYRHERSIINQRQVGDDTLGFAPALRHILRQDPDVILIGEMRDLETIEAAMTMAETGHLVFATLHTTDAVQTINRIVDVFPTNQQQQARVQLSFVLLGVVAQQLLPRVKGGRVLAMEILKVNAAARNQIRESEVHQIYTILETGSREGMITMNQWLYNLYIHGEITREVALSRSTNPDQMKRMLQQGGKAGGAGGQQAGTAAMRPA
ncbi:MAG: type IV pilus twitching motility protein PilT [Planctomycetes bacterium]|nr:type IV pilus twitching motility protein PilT [Planctomycetota bacterium]MCW8135815.1 type IV pilus twitching motility protein PilT [Planctomycetota bacterium]